MKIGSKQVDFVAQNLQGMLIYGGDHAKVLIYKDKIIDYLGQKENFTISSFDFDQACKDPTNLAGEFTTYSMFKTKKIIYLMNGGEFINKELSDLFDQSIEDVFLLITAAELPPRSTTRSYFEKSERFAVLSCYKNDAASSEVIIVDFLRSRGIRYNHEVLSYLKSCLTDNSQLLNSELNKLALYIGDKQSVNIDDVKHCTENIYNPVFDDLCCAVADNNPDKFIRCSNVLFQDKNSPIILIRIISRYFIRLEGVLQKVQDGTTTQDAVRSLQPPIFFKLIPNFNRHLQSVSLARTRNIIKKLLELEILCKKTNIAQEDIFQQSLLLALRTYSKSSKDKVKQA